MKLVKLSLVALILFLSLFSCSAKVSEEDYYKAAKEAYTKENFTLAVQDFEKLVKNYPNGKRAAEASFMLGFINANDLKNYDAAKKYYTAFINKYPKHELADDAQYELQNLGKDLNDLPIFKKLNGDSLKN